MSSHAVASAIFRNFAAGIGCTERYCTKATKGGRSGWTRFTFCGVSCVRPRARKIANCQRMSSSKARRQEAASLQPSGRCVSSQSRMSRSSCGESSISRGDLGRLVCERNDLPVGEDLVLVVNQAAARAQCRELGDASFQGFQAVDFALATLHVVERIDHLHAVDDREFSERVEIQHVHVPAVDAAGRMHAVIDGKELQQFLAAEDRRIFFDEIDDVEVPFRAGGIGEPKGDLALHAERGLRHPEVETVGNGEALVDLRRRHEDVVVAHPDMRIAIEKSRLAQQELPEILELAAFLAKGVRRALAEIGEFHLAVAVIGDDKVPPPRRVALGPSADGVPVAGARENAPTTAVLTRHVPDSTRSASRMQPRAGPYAAYDRG